jgi:alpha-L-rhamnosidase
MTSTNRNDLFVLNLRCEGFTAPLGLTKLRPGLSWNLASLRPGVRQTAYRIRVSSSPSGFHEPDLWDSGLIASDQSAFLEYKGIPLASRQRAFWIVEVHDEIEAQSQSEVAFWEMGLLEHDDWSARLISAPLAGGPHTIPPVPRLRREFLVEKPIKSARLYASAIGVYSAHLNGTRIGDSELAPGWTNYHQTLRFQTYDVTHQLLSGRNAIEVFLGDGWAAGFLAWKSRQNYRDRPAFLAQLEIEFDDGTRERIASDDNWTYAFGPLLGADALQGEAFDARLPWRDAGRVDVSPLPESLVPRASLAPPVRAIQDLPSQRVHRAKYRSRDVWVFDLGQNMVGRVRLNLASLVKPLAKGHTLRLRFAESLEGGPANTEGAIYTENLRTAVNTDYFTSDGEKESWEPTFTFHGFRYVEIFGLPVDMEPPLELVTGVVLHSDLASTGAWSCSDPLITQLQKNIDWGWRGNSLDIPTDCPQRDERLGWTGDAQVFCATSLWNRDARGFWAEWMCQMRDDQGPDGAIPCTIPNQELGQCPTSVTGQWADGGPAWADAALICPWTTYRMTGDLRILSENYDMFERYLGYLQATARENIRCYEDCGYFSGFGDWLALDGSGKTEGGTPKELIGTAFYAHAADLMSRIAHVLDKQADSRKYRQLFESIAATFTGRFVTPEGRLSPPYQTPYLLALHFDLLPPSLRKSAARELVAEIRANGHKLSTGFVGSPYINHVLTREGYLDTAYELLHQTNWPSWLYAVTKGATTIWERWDGWTEENGFQTTGMNSFNHYAYGAVGDWLFEVVAGIVLDPDVPGFKRFRLAPKPGGNLTSMCAHHDSPYGRIESEWHIDSAIFNYRFVVPPNTQARIELPDGTIFDAVSGEYTGAAPIKL